MAGAPAVGPPAASSCIFYMKNPPKNVRVNDEKRSSENLAEEMRINFWVND